MENNNKKAIMMSFMTFAILVGVVTYILIEKVGAMLPGKVGMALNSDLALNGVPVGLGFITFLALQMNPKVVAWAEEVVAELKKIVWPSRKDTVAMTIVVCIMLVVCGLLIGGFDILSGYAIDALLNMNLHL